MSTSSLPSFIKIHPAVLEKNLRLRWAKKQSDNTKNATKNFDNTTIGDWLRTVSWSNNNYPTGVVKRVYERLTFPLTAKAV